MIAKPDVYKSSTSDTYVVFGEAKIEDLASAAQQAAAQQLQAPASGLSEIKAPAAAKAASSADADDEVVDETGVESKDIELVMSQANVSRAEAVQALKNNSNDIVNAIMVRT